MPAVNTGSGSRLHVHIRRGQEIQDWHLLNGCMAALGREDFVGPFLELLREMGADQVMVFSYDEDHAACLLSWNFSHSRLGVTLAANYLDDWYRDDPLYRRVLAVQPGAAELCFLDEVAPMMSEEYRRQFFVLPGIERKAAILAAGDTHRIVLNVYQHDLERALAPPDALLFTGRLALLHYEREADSGYPPPLAALSERERQVCLGVLAGKKTEIIANEIGVAPSTVTTYRRRAYEKLGISSGAALFAICRG